MSDAGPARAAATGRMPREAAMALDVVALLALAHLAHRPGPGIDDDEDDDEDDERPIGDPDDDDGWDDDDDDDDEPPLQVKRR